MVFTSVAEVEAFERWRCVKEQIAGDYRTWRYEMRMAPTDNGGSRMAMHVHAGFVRRTAESLYHPIGTCKMGRDPLSVVDSELRVHGVESLRVVDASVIPVALTGHSNAPTIMLAEKAAENLRYGIQNPADGAPSNANHAVPAPQSIVIGRAL